MEKEFVLYRWDNPTLGSHYLVVSADVWERRVRLAMNRGAEPTRCELARGSVELMDKLRGLAMED
jgi:hypothetical protein